MPLTSRLRRAFTISTNTTTTSSSSSSSSSLSHSPQSPSPLSHAPTTVTLAPTTSTPLPKLEKTTSKLRLLLKRTKTPKQSRKIDAEWHDYNGPRVRCRKNIDPVHRAQLEAWCFDNNARSGSLGSCGGVSPGQSRCGSVASRAGPRDEEEREEDETKS